MIYYFIILLLSLISTLFAIIRCQRNIKEYNVPSKFLKKQTKFLKKQTNFSKKQIYSKPSIITYNIQKFPWSLKTFSNIKNLLKQYSIILLQECFDDTFFTLTNDFPDYYIYRQKLNNINILSSGLVIMSKYPINNYSSYHFKNYNPCTLDCLSQKGFLVAWVKINNQDICIINTHLQSSDYNRYDVKAIAQLKEILDYINSINGSIINGSIINGSFIIGGDFNIDINDLSLTPNLNFSVISPQDPTIYIDFKTGKSISNHKSGYEGLIFDYFITNKINISNVQTINNNYSDHNPVSGFIELK